MCERRKEDEEKRENEKRTIDRIGGGESEQEEKHKWKENTSK